MGGRVVVGLTEADQRRWGHFDPTLETLQNPRVKDMAPWSLECNRRRG